MGICTVKSGRGAMRISRGNVIQRGWADPPSFPSHWIRVDRRYCRPYIRVYAYRPRATDHANLEGNSILFFFLLHARNFERTSNEIDERREGGGRGRDEFLLNWRKFRDEDGFFESFSIVIGFDLDWILIF